MLLKKLPIKSLFKFLFANPLIFIVLIVVILTAVPYYYQKQTQQATTQATEAAKYQNKYIAFTSEIYDKIMTNYWDAIKDEQLIELYKLSLIKNLNQQGLTLLIQIFDK